MSIIDEGRLIAALHDAAEEIPVPDGALDRLERAIADPMHESRLTRIVARAPRSAKGRSLVAATVVMLVASGVSISSLLTPGTSMNSATRSEKSAQFGLDVQSPQWLSAQHQLSGVVTGSSDTTPTVSGTAPRIQATGSMDLTVPDGQTASALAQLTQLATRDRGFVANSDSTVHSDGSSRWSSATMVLRVPQSQFATLVAQVEHVGHATSVSTSSIDVTGQYVDLQARIRALQVIRAQYLTFITRAHSTSDVLAIETQLVSLQTQIEQLQGQLLVLGDSTTYGTLSVSTVEVGHQGGAAAVSGVLKAWRAGVGGFVGGFEGLIRIAGPTIFILICLAVALLLARWGMLVYRRRLP